MKTPFALAAILLLGAASLRADVPPPVPAESDVLGTIMYTLQYKGNPDSPETATKIKKLLTGLSPEALADLKKKAAEDEASVKKLLENNNLHTLQKGKLERRLKSYQTLRERFLTASLEMEGTRTEAYASGKTRAMVSGLALTLGLALAGVMFVRRGGR